MIFLEYFQTNEYFQKQCSDREITNSMIFARQSKINNQTSGYFYTSEYFQKQCLHLEITEILWVSVGNLKLTGRQFSIECSRNSKLSADTTRNILQKQIVRDNTNVNHSRTKKRGTKDWTNQWIFNHEALKSKNTTFLMNTK